MAISGGNVTVPFQLSSLASLLGVSKVGGYYRQKDICTASGINMWSKVKPVRHSDPGPLTAAQFAEVNYGFNLTGIMQTSAASALAAAKTNSGAWTYQKPRGYVSAQLSEWFRQRDFNGYHHGAAQPYECLGPSSPYGYRSIPVQVYDMVEEGAELSLTDFTELADGSDTGRTIDEWRLGLAWRLGSSGNVQVMYHPDTLDDCFQPSAGEDPHEQLTFTASQDGTWEWCIFITDYDPTDDPNSGNSYRYVYLPGGFGQVTVDTSSVVTPPVTIGIDGVTVTGSPYVTAVEMDLTAQSSDEYDVQAYIRIYDETDEFLKEGYDQVSMASSEEYIYPEVTGINFLGNYEKTDLFVRMQLKYRLGAGSWTTVWYNPVSGQYTTTMPQAYDLDTIIDSLDENNV